MASTWLEMSADCLRASKKLLDEGLYRRSMSSAYYAAYSAITAELVAKGVTFAHGWQNPAHEQLPELVMNRISLARKDRYQLRAILRLLRQARENADYRPNVTITIETARECVRFAQLAIRILEERHG